MNVVALVLAQFVALPTPLTFPPGGPLLIRADVARGSAAEFGGRTVIAFTSNERQVATRSAINAAGDLWLATWDGVTLTSRLLCQAGAVRFLQAHLAATPSTVLIVSRTTSGLHVLSLDAALQPQNGPCGVVMNTDEAQGLSVTASGNDFVVTYQNVSTGAVEVRWITSSGVLMHTVSSAAPSPSAAPVSLAIDGGALVVYRATTSGDLSVLATSPTLPSSTGTAPNTATFSRWSLMHAGLGPLLVGWASIANGWELGVNDLGAGTRIATPRLLVGATTTATPPAPLLLSTDAGVGIISWIPGSAPLAQLNAFGGPSVFASIASVPVDATLPGTLITQEQPDVYAVRSVDVAPPLVGAALAYVNARPSHQRSANVAWTALGWLLVWEEPRTGPGPAPQTVVRAALIDERGSNVTNLAVQQVPGRSPRVRRRPTPGGPLLASFELRDGGTTIVPLTVTSSMLFVGTTPFAPDIGALGGFEVNPTELVRWTPGTTSPADVHLGTNLVGAVQSASPRGAFATDTFWLPRVGLAQTSPFALPGGMPLASTSIVTGPVDGPIAVGAAPYLAPSELLYAWNELDGGLKAVLQTAPPALDSSFSTPTARFFGGRPVRLAGRWLVGLRPIGGGVVIFGMHPTLTTIPVRLGEERGQIVEFESAETPDGGSAAFVWTSWEDDGLDAGLRLSFQIVSVRGDGGLVDAGSPDAGSGDGGAADAGANDGGAANDAGPDDAGALSDAGLPSDAGVSTPGASDQLVLIPESCGCDGTGARGLLLLALMTALRRRRRTQQPNGR